MAPNPKSRIYSSEVDFNFCILPPSARQHSGMTAADGDHETSLNISTEEAQGCDDIENMPWCEFEKLKKSQE